MYAQRALPGGASFLAQSLTTSGLCAHKLHRIRKFYTFLLILIFIFSDSLNSFSISSLLAINRNSDSCLWSRCCTLCAIARLSFSSIGHILVYLLLYLAAVNRKAAIQIICHSNIKNNSNKFQGLWLGNGIIGQEKIRSEIHKFGRLNS